MTRHGCFVELDDGAVPVQKALDVERVTYLEGGRIPGPWTGRQITA
ncbi:hypothetical protein ACWFRM_22350 [Streptomyces sp. NPDC055144]